MVGFFTKAHLSPSLLAGFPFTTIPIKQRREAQKASSTAATFTFVAFQEKTVRWTPLFSQTVQRKYSPYAWSPPVSDFCPS